MSKGVQFSETIDLIAESSDGSEFAVVMIEERPWDGSQQRRRELREKINNYSRFILGGQLEKEYPEATGASVSIRLYHAYEPDESVIDFIEQAKPLLASKGIDFEVRPIPQDLERS